MSRRNSHDQLTLISEVLKLGAVVVVVQDEDVELADADERVSGLVGGGDRHRVLPLALPVKLPRRHDHSCRRVDAKN